MELIDTHCHLDFEPLSDLSNTSTLEHTLSLAKAEGVSTIVLPAVKASRWPGVLDLSHLNTGIQLIPALGLHPCFLDDHADKDLLELEALLTTHKDTVKAIGETGLDLFIENPRINRQIELLNKQIELAIEFDLPLLLHGRRSVDQLLKLLRRARPQAGGVVHAFSGSEQQAAQLWELGFHIGLGGSITYQRAQRLQRVAASVPLESILLETDAPDMPLCGFQGEPNWPHQVGRVARTLANIRGVDVEQIAVQTTANARRMFGLS